MEASNTRSLPRGFCIKKACMKRPVLVGTTSRVILVGVAQLVEHQVVALVVEGSSPFTHPMTHSAPVAQLDRAPDFESVGRGFESLRARHTKK